MKAVIIEDELLIAKELKYKIEHVAPDVEVLEILTSLKTSRKWFMQNGEPDLLFMDIQLSDGISFEIFDEFTLHCPVIFTTAYDEFAVKAFRNNGIDYLLKPIDSEDLAAAIGKCRQYLGKNSNSHSQPDLRQLLTLFHGDNNTVTFKEKFIVHYRNNWIPVNVEQIACFERDNLNYLITMKGEKYAIDFDSLDEVEEMLNPQVFFRANRQYIINIESIQRVVPHDNLKLTVYLNAIPQTPIDISREKSPAFRKWLDR